MSSKQEAGQTPAQETPEVQVTDKRRFSPEGEPLEEAAAEPVDPPAEATGAAQTLELELLRMQLRLAEEKRAEAEARVIDFQERFRRAQEQLKVETDEQRARMQRTFEQRLEAGRADILASLLDSLDNLKRALSVAEKGEKREADFDALLEGLRATAGMFEAKMAALGLTAVPGVGTDFNPEFHEAVEMVVVPAEQDNKVMEEYQTGYKLGDRLLRPARVRVGRAGN